MIVPHLTGPCCIDENGIVRLEKLFFDAYNESDILIGAVPRQRHKTSRRVEQTAVVRKNYQKKSHTIMALFHYIQLNFPELVRSRSPVSTYLSSITSCIRLYHHNLLLLLTSNAGFCFCHFLRFLS